MKLNTDILDTISKNDVLLEVGRKAIEDVLVDFRDSMIFTIRNNGLVIKERNGENSSIIRLGPEQALKIGIEAISKYLKKNSI